MLSWSLGLVGAIGRPLGGHDEPRVAGIARGMALSGDYAVPRLNATPYLDYPQLGYVPTAIALRVAGVPSEFAARLPIVLLGGAVVCLIAWAAAAFGGRRLGVASGALLATSVGFLNHGWKLVVDPVLCSS